MKNLLRIISLALVACMLFSFAACAPQTNPADTGKGADGTNDPAGEENTTKYADIAGEYLLDGSNLGMPMKWYIKVSADGKFVISTERDYATVKGEGTIGDKDGTYMFVYSDSTTETPKTATFKFEGKNMVFSTKVPIGAASLSPNEEEQKYPTAKLIANEDILGSYLGTLEKSAMGSAVVYSFALDLVIGNEYTFTSSVTMMNTTLTRVEKGAFDVEGGKIFFTAATVDDKAVEAPEKVEGTIDNKTIKAKFTLSSMAKTPDEIEAKFGEYAEYAGQYVGVYQKSMGPSMTLKYGVVIELDAFGGYSYYTFDASDSSKADYSEVGTYTVADGKFSFKSNKDGAAAVEGTLENYVLKAKFPISAMMSTPVDVSFYAEEVCGSFEATTEEDGKSYGASLVLAGNTFILAGGLTTEDAPRYVAVGTFEIKGGMMTTIELTTEALFKDVAMTQAVNTIPAELKKISAPVADSGINAELLFDLDDAKLVGFQFAH